MKGRRFHLLIAAMLLLSSAIAWLMQSQAALQWAWSRVEALSRGVVSARQIDGVLAGPITLHGLVIRTPDAEITLSRGVFDWHAGQLLLGRLRVTELRGDELVVTLLQTGETAPATGNGFSGLAAPLTTSVDHLSLGRLVVRSEAQELLHFDNIQVTDADWLRDELWVDQLAFDSPWVHLSARGHVATRLDGPASLTATLRLNRQWFDSDLQASGTVRGTLGQPQLDMALAGAVQGHLAGRITWAGGPLHWQATTDLQPFSLHQLQPGWRPLQVGGHLVGEGDFLNNRLNGSVILADAALGRWHGEAALTQQGAQIEVQRAVLDGAGHPAHLEGSGKVTLVAAPDYLADTQLQLIWRNLGWPVMAKAPPWRSDEGQAQVSGTLRDYHLVTDLHLALPGAPPFRAQLDAQGDLNHLASRSLQLQGLDGTATGEATVTWSPQLAWHAHLLGKRLDPARHWPQWPGRLDLDIASDGAWHDKRFDIDVRELQGTLHGHPLHGRGKAEYTAGRWALSGLDVQSGKARFTAHGALAAPWSVQWQLDAPQLGQLLPEARGALHLEGTIAGEGRLPQITTRGKGSTLRWGGWRLQQGSLDAVLDLGGSSPWRLRLTLEQLLHNDQLLADTISLQGDGTAAAHTLTLALERSGDHFTQQVEGSYRDGEWRARLQGGAWRGADKSIWLQEAPAQLRLSAATVLLEPFCWRSGEARACLSSRSLASGGSELVASLHGLPMAPFSPLLPRSNIQLGGELFAEAHAHLQQGVHEVSLDAHITGGTLRYQHPLQTIDLRFTTSSVSLHSTAQGTVASAEFVLSNGDSIHLEQQLPGWLIGQPLHANQPVAGKANLSMHDLAWLTIFVPEIVQPKGSVTAQLNLSGTVADPRLTGNLGLSDGSVVIPRAGVTVTQIGMLASSPDGVTLRLSGAARSGPGWVTLEGSVVGETLDNWRSELQLHGERFEVVRLPSVHLLASPEVKVAIQPHRIDLDGRLVIPEADIHLPELPTTVRSSSDVVLVEGSKPVVPPEKWRINSRLTLQLGDYIRVEGYGFKGRVAGQLTITEKPDEPATGQGELTVPEGRYKAYGQDLTIETGRLLFANSLLDDPGLDVRASRSVQDVKVGVNITGRLQRPELRLFSEPAMEESDVLSYLVLGHPLRTASSSEAGSVSAAATSLGLVGGERIAQAIGSQFGVDEVSVGTEYGAQDTALLLGKYLSPRLYLQYAVVFSNALNITRLRYELTNHWFVKLESGEQQSADILYTFER